VVVGDVDCTVEEDLCARFAVSGYPTLKYFTSETGASGEAYELGRDLASLKAFVQETLEIKCALDDREKCTEKETAYLEKMTAAGVSKEDVAAALRRLEGMQGASMKPELKQWIVQRKNILKQIQEA
jgi:protein disulfide-isomerase A6